MHTFNNCMPYFLPYCITITVQKFEIGPNQKPFLVTTDTGPSLGHVAEFGYGKYLILPCGTLRRYNKVRIFRLITFRQNTNHNVDKTHLICYRSVIKRLVLYEYSGSACDRLLLGQGSSEIELKYTR